MSEELRTAESGLYFLMTNILLSSFSPGLNTLQNSSLEEPHSLSLGNNVNRKCHTDVGADLLVVAKGWDLTFTEQGAGAT